MEIKCIHEKPQMPAIIQMTAIKVVLTQWLVL